MFKSAFGDTSRGESKYGAYETDGGKLIRVRMSDHRGNALSIIKKGGRVEEGYSVVIKTNDKPKFKPNKKAYVTEYVYNNLGDTGETRYDLQPRDNSGGIALFVKDGVVARNSMDEFEGKPLEQVVGKELAAKMLEMKDYSILNIADMPVGGERMRGFYDEILPRFMNKYGKKWGVKVYDIDLPNVEDAGRHMWAVANSLGFRRER